MGLKEKNHKGYHESLGDIAPTDFCSWGNSNNPARRKENRMDYEGPLE
jgi:hypothetical protein